MQEVCLCGAVLCCAWWVGVGGVGAGGGGDVLGEKELQRGWKGVSKGIVTAVLCG